MGAIAFVAQAERDLLTTAKRSSRKYLNTVLADGFIEIGQSGQLYDKTSIIATLLASPQTQAAMADLSVRKLTEVFILASYKTSNPLRNTYPICRHSLWQKLEGGWQLLYHEAEADNG